MTIIAQVALLVTLVCGRTPVECCCATRLRPAPAAPALARAPGPAEWGTVTLRCHVEASGDAARQARATDQWLAEDKLRHLFMSFATVSYSYGAGRLATVSHDPALAIAVVAGAAAGLGKEVHDKRRGWGFSVKDLVWDAAGVAAGVLLLSSVR